MAKNPPMTPCGSPSWSRLTEAITAVLRKNEGVCQLFDNGWLHLLALDQGHVVARYLQNLRWEEFETETSRPR